MANETKSSDDHTPARGSKDSAANPVQQHGTGSAAATHGGTQHATDRTTEQQAPHPPAEAHPPADPRMTTPVMNEEEWNATLENEGVTPEAEAEAKNREAWNKQEQERQEAEKKEHERQMREREHK